MKKFLFFILFLCVAQVSFAQLRIEAGGALGSFSRSFFGYNIGSKKLSAGMGFDANVSYGIKLLGDKSGTLCLAPGVGYLLNNVSVKGSDTKLRLQWIQAPLNVVESLPVGKNIFTSALGLYYGYALSGKYVDPSGEWDGKDFLTQPGERLLKRNDFGFNVKVGFLFSGHFGLYIGYTRGFLDISNTSGLVAHTNIFRFGVMFSL